MLTDKSEIDEIFLKFSWDLNDLKHIMGDAVSDALLLATFEVLLKIFTSKVRLWQCSIFMVQVNVKVQAQKAVYVHCVTQCLILYAMPVHSSQRN